MQYVRLTHILFVSHQLLEFGVADVCKVGLKIVGGDGSFDFAPGEPFVVPPH